MSWLLLFLEMDLSLFKMFEILFYICMIILSSTLANFIQVINLFIMFFFFHMENWIGIYICSWKRLKQVNQMHHCIEENGCTINILWMHGPQLNKVISTGFDTIRKLSVQICIRGWWMQLLMLMDCKTLASVLSYLHHILAVHVQCISCIRTLWHFGELCRNQTSFFC